MMIIQNAKKNHLFTLIITAAVFLTVFSGCQTNSQCFEADIVFDQQPCYVKNLPSPFPDMTKEEYRQDWGKELVIARSFADELDFYRAITSYKRALILIPDKYTQRRLQIEYGILECYYLAGKYQDVLDTFEPSQLLTFVPNDFPAINDLLMMVYDSYQRTGQTEKACKIMELLESRDACTARNLEVSEAIREGDLKAIKCFAASDEGDEGIAFFFDSYRKNTLSVRKAELLNAIIPGAGYLYVGQKQSAITSFCINALFITAAYQFFHHGNIAAGIITASLETGWYFGGINGAGLEAKEYNRRIYETMGKQVLVQKNLFPVLMLHYGF